jgi:hypothetical protein
MSTKLQFPSHANDICLIYFVVLDVWLSSGISTLSELCSRSKTRYRGRDFFCRRALADTDSLHWYIAIRGVRSKWGTLSGSLTIQYLDCRPVGSSGGVIVTSLIWKDLDRRGHPGLIEAMPLLFPGGTWKANTTTSIAFIPNEIRTRMQVQNATIT